MPRRRASGAGRPSKGDRDSIIAYPPLPLGQMIRARAVKERLSISDYVATVLAHELGRPGLAPITPPYEDRPSEDLRSAPLSVTRTAKNGRDHILTRPMRELGDLIRAKAEETDVTLSDYITGVLAIELGAPEHSPSPRPGHARTPEDAVEVRHRQGVAV